MSNDATVSAALRLIARQIVGASRKDLGDGLLTELLGRQLVHAPGFEGVYELTSLGLLILAEEVDVDQEVDLLNVREENLVGIGRRVFNGEKFVSKYSVPLVEVSTVLA